MLLVIHEGPHAHLANEWVQPGYTDAGLNRNRTSSTLRFIVLIPRDKA
ncbi:hypothetical protein CJA_0213 [Cellvibrio japonicus Ueda107]|uniref:Uncharacterized protein n=1 Tax=Cellvibrio japonicus (strain Ueda107) TaxID=498211 RepID=B3PGF8_CELJU|nr:hypothetical protein CJA_0213 [Cellvibrio japonicus Ueda107]